MQPNLICNPPASVPPKCWNGKSCFLAFKPVAGPRAQGCIITALSISAWPLRPPTPLGVPEWENAPRGLGTNQIGATPGAERLDLASTLGSQSQVAAGECVAAWTLPMVRRGLAGRGAGLPAQRLADLRRPGRLRYAGEVMAWVWPCGPLRGRAGWAGLQIPGRGLSACPGEGSGG